MQTPIYDTRMPGRREKNYLRMFLNIFTTDEPFLCGILHITSLKVVILFHSHMKYHDVLGIISMIYYLLNET